MHALNRIGTVFAYCPESGVMMSIQGFPSPFSEGDFQFKGIENSAFSKLEDDLISLAKERQALSPDLWVTSQWFHSQCAMAFSETQIKHLVKTVATQVGIDFAETVANVLSENEAYSSICQNSLNIERAKREAIQNGWQTSNSIKNYGITDPSALVEIAMIAAAQDGRSVSYFIKNYGITDPKALVEIAMIAAAEHGEGTSYFIKNYGITDSEALIAIAKIAA
ncbi:MAG: hypothetical protein KDK48_04485, partial [Chlamydiia bacterium]|nr:hypothetical protein [Chlamydiia bacterium]